MYTLTGGPGSPAGPGGPSRPGLLVGPGGPGCPGTPWLPLAPFSNQNKYYKCLITLGMGIYTVKQRSLISYLTKSSKFKLLLY